MQPHLRLAATADIKRTEQLEIWQPGMALSELAVSGDRRDRGGSARFYKNSPVNIQYIEKEVKNMSKVNVYDDEGNVIARVKYNDNLDQWDGSNHTSGSTGHHLGITQLADGRFVLIYGTQWQGESDRAEIISRDCAVQQILKSGDENMLDKYGLRKDATKTLIEEAE